MSVLTALSMTITAILLAITVVFGEGSSAFQPKDEGALKKLLNRPADVLTRLAGKAV